MFKNKEDRKAYHKAYHAKWYQENKERNLTRIRKNKKALKTWFIEYKSSLKCEQCGASHPAIFDFHHRDGEGKELVSMLVANNYGKERILEEIAKCRVLCSNCHRILHWEHRGNRRPFKE